MRTLTAALLAIAAIAAVAWAPLRVYTVYKEEISYAVSKLEHAHDVIRVCNQGNERPEFGLLDCASARETVRTGIRASAHLEVAIARLAQEVWDTALWTSTDVAMAAGWRGLLVLTLLPIATLLGRRAARSVSSVLVPLDTLLEEDAPMSALPPSFQSYKGYNTYHTPAQSTFAHPSPFKWQSAAEWEHIKGD